MHLYKVVRFYTIIFPTIFVFVFVIPPLGEFGVSMFQHCIVEDLCLLLWL